MLTTVLEVAYRSIDKILMRLEETPPVEVLEKIQDSWIRYAPREKRGYECIGAVDSGYNYAEMSGFYIYVVDAGYIDTCLSRDEEAVVGIEDLSVDPRDLLDILSIRLETEILVRELDRKTGSLVIVDGSLLKKISSLTDTFIRSSRLRTYARETIDLLKRVLETRPREVVFVSKNSGSQDLLRSLGIESSKTPDIYLLEEYTREIGYTRPRRLTVRIEESEYEVWTSYIRIETGGPILRTEYFMGDDRVFIESLIDTLHSVSLRGVPVVMSLIDSMVRVGDQDLEKVLGVLPIDRRRFMERGGRV